MQTHDKPALPTVVFLMSTVMVAAACGNPKATTNHPDGAQAETSGDNASPDADVPDAAGPDAPSPDAASTTTTATMTFRFKNTKTVPVFLRRDCQILIAVTSSADGETYSNGSFCACDCDSSTCLGGLACGACAPPSGEELPPGAVVELIWVARSSTLQVKMVQQTFQCVAHAPIPTGTYTVEMVVYDTQQDAVAKMNAHPVEKTFTLGTTDAVVEVPIL